jgi:hypothetical protein
MIPIPFQCQSNMVMVVSEKSGEKRQVIKSMTMIVYKSLFRRCKNTWWLNKSIPQKIRSVLDYALCMIYIENIRKLWCRRYYNPCFCLPHGNELLSILAICIHRRDKLNRTVSIQKNSLLVASLKSSNVITIEESNQGLTLGLSEST